MALIRCNTSTGGYDTPCIVGTFEVTSYQETVTVNCGFRPKYIAVVFQGSAGTGSTIANGGRRYIYDERLGTGSHTGQRANGDSALTVNTTAMSSSTATRVSEVNSNGFKFYNGGNSNIFYGTYNFFAIG